MTQNINEKFWKNLNKCSRDQDRWTCAVPDKSFTVTIHPVAHGIPPVRRMPRSELTTTRGNSENRNNWTQDIRCAAALWGAEDHPSSARPRDGNQYKSQEGDDLEACDLWPWHTAVCLIVYRSCRSISQPRRRTLPCWALTMKALSVVVLCHLKVSQSTCRACSRAVTRQDIAICTTSMQRILRNRYM